MQYAEIYRGIGHQKHRHQSNRKGCGEDSQSPPCIVFAKHTGHTAYQYECSRKEGADVCQNVKERPGESVTVHISQRKQRVVEYHTEYTETADFIQSVDSFFCGQGITLFKLVVERRKKIY